MYRDLKNYKKNCQGRTVSKSLNTHHKLDSRPESVMKLRLLASNRATVRHFAKKFSDLLLRDLLLHDDQTPDLSDFVKSFSKVNFTNIWNPCGSPLSSVVATMCIEVFETVAWKMLLLNPKYDFVISITLLSSGHFFFLRCHASFSVGDYIYKFTLRASVQCGV